MKLTRVVSAVSLVVCVLVLGFADLDPDTRAAVGTCLAPLALAVAQMKPAVERRPKKEDTP